MGILSEYDKIQRIKLATCLTNVKLKCRSCGNENYFIGKEETLKKTLSMKLKPVRMILGTIMFLAMIFVQWDTIEKGDYEMVVPFGLFILIIIIAILIDSIKWALKLFGIWQIFQTKSRREKAEYFKKTKAIIPLIYRERDKTTSAENLSKIDELATYKDGTKKKPTINLMCPNCGYIKESVMIECP